MLVATKDDAALPVHINVDVEPIGVHVLVDRGACIVLAEVDARSMALENLLDELGDGALVRVGLGIIPLEPIRR